MVYPRYPVKEAQDDSTYYSDKCPGGFTPEICPSGGCCGVCPYDTVDKLLEGQKHADPVIEPE